MGRIPLPSIVFLALIGIAAGSCKTSEKGEGPAHLDPVRPGEVRVLGTLTDIDSMLTRRATDPCSRVPCRATVRIDSILEYGSAFPRPLSKGEHVRAHFAFTLSPTEDVMPELATSFPGLEEGASFWTNLSAQAVPGPGADTMRFIVYEYYRTDK